MFPIKALLSEQWLAEALHRYPELLRNRHAPKNHAAYQ